MLNCKILSLFSLSLLSVYVNATPRVSLAIPEVFIADSKPVTLEFGSNESLPANTSLALQIVATRADGSTLTATTDITVTDATRFYRTKLDLSQFAISADAKVSVQLVPSTNAQYLRSKKSQDQVIVLSETSYQVTEGSPFGIAPSHASSHFSTWWLDPIRQAGIDWIRGYDSRSDWVDLRLAEATDAGYQVTGILSWSAGDGFPDENIAGWEDYVLTKLIESNGTIRQWEVWNEPPNFSDDKDPAHYAAIVRAAYDVVKNYDPSYSVGLAASSVNLNFLDQALQDTVVTDSNGVETVMPGAYNHFDYITLHPYESAGNMMDHGYDALYISIASTTRKMLAARNPEKQFAPIVLTEIGTPLVPGGEDVADLTPAEKAEELERQGIMAFKTYVLSLAQDIARIHWFEPQDSEGLSFGLIEGDIDNWQKRPAFNAIATLSSKLGSDPEYLGWVLLDDQHTGYVFRNGNKKYLAAWLPPMNSESVTIDMGKSVTVYDPLTGNSSQTKEVTLSHVPVLIDSPTYAMIHAAKVNRFEPFPWGGDYSGASSISLTATAESGLHTSLSNTVQVDGETVFDISQGSSIPFALDPNFNSYDSIPLLVTAEVKFKGDPNDTSLPTPGFNLRYESQELFKNHSIGWRQVPKDGEWHTITWEVTDAQFVGFWGYNFSLNSDSTTYSNYYLRNLTIEKL